MYNYLGEIDEMVCKIMDCNEFAIDMCMHMCICTYVCKGSYSCACMWKPENRIRFSLVSLFFEVLSLPKPGASLAFELDWLAREPQGTA